MHTRQGQTGTKKRGRELDTRSRFTDEEIERGLVALALCSGNSRRASTALGGQGFKVAQSSLHRLRNRFPEKYEQLRRDVLPQLREYAAERHMELADFEVGVAWKIAQQLDEHTERFRPATSPALYETWVSPLPCISTRPKPFGASLPGRRPPFA